MIKKLVIASTNKGKVKEFQNILHNYELISQNEFLMPDIIEDGLSFVENAIIKARAVAKITSLPTIADDSGLVVEALAGEPGIHSSRYSEGGAEGNIDKLLVNMQDINNRKAQFYCAIVMVRNYKDPAPIITTASWNGEILTSRIGRNGFGYDSIFFIPKLGKSSAQLTANEKNKISHRGLALKEFKTIFNKNYFA